MFSSYTETENRPNERKAKTIRRLLFTSIYYIIIIYYYVYLVETKIHNYNDVIMRQRWVR